MLFDAPFIDFLIRVAAVTAALTTIGVFLAKSFNVLDKIGDRVGAKVNESVRKIARSEVDLALASAIKENHLLNTGEIAALFDERFNHHIEPVYVTLHEIARATDVIVELTTELAPNDGSTIKDQVREIRSALAEITSLRPLSSD